MGVVVNPPKGRLFICQIKYFPTGMTNAIPTAPRKNRGRTAEVPRKNPAEEPQQPPQQGQTHTNLNRKGPQQGAVGGSSPGTKGQALL